MIRESNPGWSFDAFFRAATEHIPYPFQRKLATSLELPDLIEIPTGMGKTDAVILSWLWRRRFDPRVEVRSNTPRRLVYCLPMRVLVEQTQDKTIKWLRKLGIFAKSPGDEIPITVPAASYDGKGKRIAVTVLMGGEDQDWWDRYPERDAIIIGTQDMLLSRALNRGYGMSRYRWPTQFGLLNNDCLWVMDEVQLMGRGLATTTQIQAFRDLLGTIDTLQAESVWMSATLEREWLKTVDFDPETKLVETLALGPDDRAETSIQKRIRAVKTLRKIEPDSTDPKGIAEVILEKHRPRYRTLVVVNTVGRAVGLYRAINGKTEAKLVLVHSRFRPPDRKKIVEDLRKEPDSKGTIIVSTQVVEAGVDLSSKVMFTEVAPWPSLVQRFGRCNRAGKYDDAEIYWIDVPTEKKGSALPYTEDELDEARNVLSDREGQSVGPDLLPKVPQKYEHEQVIRLKDMVDLFDTTPDLAGHDIDISRFIRETSDTDVQVFWRDLPDDGPTAEDPEGRPRRDELCSVPVGEIRDLVGKSLDAWIWDSLDGQWIRANSDLIYPGITLMLRARDGHYTVDEGWSVGSRRPVPVIVPEIKDSTANSYSGNEMATGDWMSIAEHTNQVCQEMTKILESLELDGPWEDSLLEGSRWHDAGKAHKSFQAMIKKDELENFTDPPAAKAPADAWRRGRLPDKPQEYDDRRKYFRHELVSGIVALLNDKDDLTAYLAAAHHGKVRMAIRSMPGEFRPTDESIRFARGVWDGDVVPETDLGGDVVMPATTIDLSFMELGRSSNGPSWLSRTLDLRDRPDLGPFRLAFLEGLMKAADERASGGGGV